MKSNIILCFLFVCIFSHAQEVELIKREYKHRSLFESSQKDQIVRHQKEKGKLGHFYLDQSDPIFKDAFDFAFSEKNKEVIRSEKNGKVRILLELIVKRDGSILDVSFFISDNLLNCDGLEKNLKTYYKRIVGKRLDFTYLKINEEGDYARFTYVMPY